jgi:hypothetical protein
MLTAAVLFATFAASRANEIEPALILHAPPPSTQRKRTVMRLLSPIVLACGLLSGSAGAQQIIFQDSFETGLSAWTATGLWNPESSSDTCGATFEPPPSGTSYAWYGNPANCLYNNGSTNFGSLTLNDWIQLPSDAVSISMRYWASSLSEYCFENWDIHSVQIIAQNGPNGGFTSQYCDWFDELNHNDLPWHERRIDLSAYRGAQVRFSFDFNTVDEKFNDGRGWLIDDVRVLIEPGTRYCPPSNFNNECPCHWPRTPPSGGCRNSVGKSATLYSEGVPTVSADTLRINAVQLPPTTTALLSQGTASAQVVFGDGIRCVGGIRIRMGAHAAVGGTATWPAVGEDPLSVRGAIPAAGGTRYYYIFYRDIGNFCTTAAFNLTDAQQIVWAP